MVFTVTFYILAAIVIISLGLCVFVAQVRHPSSNSHSCVSWSIPLLASAGTESYHGSRMHPTVCASSAVGLIHCFDTTGFAWSTCCGNWQLLLSTVSEFNML